ncbi:unnamed protein product [Euphydryas editha]|uniref:Uncharacterized protein n=1 Tax=Euphydryas editha TaxID=104508 RepID=A0AAU9V0Q5_EUPED|nr:unnamed protein product [Euphydryas editha]
MKSLQTDNMKRQQKICVFTLCIAALIGLAASSKRESRTGGLHIPEKIIGGVIDIVQSHKNKPIQGGQPTYPPNPQYNYQQYPQYQQWNGQSNFQNQGFQPQPQFQGQYQNQGQYSYQNGYNQGNFPQDGGNYNHVNPAGSSQSFNQGQNQQGQYQHGQYQAVYQNPNQFTQPNNNQFQNTQSGYYNGQTQTNQHQGTSGSFQQPGHTQGQTSGSGQFSQGQGFMVTGGQSGGNGQGPTCVCQAWTKPQPHGQEVFADTPETEKSEKKD